MYEIRPVKPDEIDVALSLLLDEGHIDRGQLTKKIESFKKLADRERNDLSRQIVVVRHGQIVYACLVVPQPGRTAFVFTASSPSLMSTTDGIEAIIEAVEKLCRMAQTLEGRLLQIIIEPDDIDRLALCRKCHFTLLTDLLYLCYSVEKHTLEEPLPITVQWTSYQQTDHERFKDVIRCTYHGSLDCPELEHLRDLEDVIRGHRAVGQFDPARWRLLWNQRQPVGVLLLAAHPEQAALEVVYMGLIPQARQNRIGRLMLNEAVAIAQKNKAEHIFLAVDSRNQPACRLYGHFGFQTVCRKTVLIKSLTGEAG